MCPLRDLVHNALKEGSPKFTENEKPHKEADYDPRVEDVLFVELVEILIVGVIEALNTKIDEVNMLNYKEKVKMVYPKAEEELIDFLNRCKLKDS